MKIRNLQSLPLGLLLIALASAQTRVDLANQSRGIDFSAAAATKPSKTGTVFPFTCSVGETFFKTNAQAGKNLYACTTTDVWSALASPIDVANVSGMSGKIMSTDGTNTTWTAPSGDVSGFVSNLTVTAIQGRTISSDSPQNGNVLSWNSVLSQWQPSTTPSTTYVAGAGVTIAGSTVAVDSATVPQYSIGSGAPALSCDPGRNFYTDTLSGDLYVCNFANTWKLLSPVGHLHATSDLSSGTVSLVQGGTNQIAWVAGRCVQIAGDGTRLESASAACGPRSSTGSGAPAMACNAGQDLYTDTSTANLYYCGATNAWQLVSRPGHAHSAADISSGTLALARGGSNQASWIAGRCVQVKSDGTTLESAAGACGPFGTTGAGAPGGSCTAGQDLYTDTTAGNLYYCSALNTWQLLSRTDHAHAASDLTSGTLPLTRGGSGQTSWIAGRCVQVKSDGTTLESAAGVCGAGGGSPTIVTDLLTTASVSPYNFPTDLKYFHVFFCAGGGGGAGSLTTSSGGGGGGAGCEEAIIQLNGGTSLAFTVGAGGAGGAAGQAGGAGGPTSFTVGGFTYSVQGGSGGLANASSGAGGRGFVLGTIAGTTLGLTAANAIRRDQGGPGGTGRNSPSIHRDAGAGICVGGSGGSFTSTSVTSLVQAYHPPNGISAAPGSGASGAPTAGSPGSSCNGGAGGGTDAALTTAGGTGGSGYIRISYTY